MNKILQGLESNATRSAVCSVLLLAAASAWHPAFAAQTDISNTPLTSTTSAQVKPNIMLLMDTSGSMGWGHMPDEVETATGTGSVGYKAAQCNVLYYNRQQTYLLPKKPDGTPFPTPSFTSAPYAGFVGYYVSPDATDLSNVNLSTAFNAYDDKTLRVPAAAAHVPQAAYYYYYTGSQTLTYGTAPCTDTDTNISKTATGGGTWNRVAVGATSGPGGIDERQNFAIWFAYYRTRIALTKSAASLAFTPLTDSFRVGFITVNPKDDPAASSINTSKYVAIADFDSTQRLTWFNKLFAQAPGGSSPAREGLSRVGRHYAGKQDGINAGMTGDPVQYSCQQNFTIMTTDGYWNAQAETPGGGAVQIDGTTKIGQQDGSLTDSAGDSPRPIWDGSATSTRTDRDAMNGYSNVACSGTATTLSTLQRRASTQQITASTSQTSRTTQQYTTSGVTYLRNTAQYTTGTVQTSRTTQQYTTSTLQRLQTTQQYTATTSQTTRTRQQFTTSTLQNLRSTATFTRTTDQTSKNTRQYTTSTLQKLQTTYQRTQGQTQVTLGQTQKKQRQYQIISYNALTELGTPVASCTPGGNITCQTRIVTALTPVASCTTGSTTTGSPNFIVTECSDVVVASVAPVASCTPGTTQSGSPNFITSTCTSVTVAATANVASCTPGTTQSAGPNYITTTCTAVPLTTNVFVAACTPGTTAGPSFVTTTCPTPITTGPVGISSCTAGTTSSGAPNYISTTCTFNNTTVFVANAAACSNQSAGGGNNYTEIICNTANTGPTLQTSACTPGTTAGTSPSFVNTTCTRNAIVTNEAIPATCVAGNSGSPNYIITTCPAPATTAAVGVQVCTPGTTSSGAPNYMQTTCTNTITPTFVTNAAACTTQTAAAGNQWVTYTCNTVTNPPAIVATCAVGTTNSGAPNYITTVCTVTTLTNNVPVANCTPGTGPGPAFIVTTCAGTPTAPVGVPTCTPGTTTSGPPNFIQTTCVYNNNTVFVANAAACTTQIPVAGNQWTTIGCNTVTVPAAPSPTACTPGTTSSNAPNYLITTCVRNTLSTNEPIPAACVAGNSGAPNYTITTCPAATVTPAVGVSSCTPGTSSTGAPNYVNTTCTYSNNTVFVTNAAACTNQVGSSGNSYINITCATATTAPAFVPTCTPGSSGSPNYVNTTCVTVPGTASTPVATCTLGNSTGPAPDYIITNCNETVVSAATPVASCTAGTGPAPDYFRTVCGSGVYPGLKQVFSTTYTTTTTRVSGGFDVGTPSVVITTGATTDVDGVCYITGVSSPPTPLASHRPVAPELPAAPTGCAAWPCATVDPSPVGGSSNSLADVAQYYYATDLRPGPAWPNNVPTVGSGPEDDRSTKQHMTTFTIALGVSGTLNYRADYRSAAATTGDFAAIRTGPAGWPIWPDPDNFDYTNPDNWNNPKSIDDFWHAAVNGRGQYFSAGNPTSVVAGLSGALVGINARVASASGAGSSSLEPVAGDNFSYVATYTTAKWTGDITAQAINLSTGALDPTISWSAQALLDTATGAACDNRTIYLMRQGATDNKVNFTWNTSACDSGMLPTGSPSTGLNSTEQAFFGAGNVSLLSQYPSMTDGTLATVDQRTAAIGQNLVNFLRGQRGLEAFESNILTKLYRQREHVLGDVVDAAPVYVKAPFATYQDAGYDTFKSSNVGRTPMVYVGANDGMLHAFYAGTSTTDPQRGKEAWAMIPTTVLPNLYKLADDNYRNTHQFFVDGTPTIGDVYDTTAAAWKTVLVGGLNFGGRAYYAVDVTNPTAPKALWEFKWSNTCYDGTPATAGADCHLGYTFGRPVISKLINGTWVVMFTSGYNNVNAPPKTGDGQGYLYVLNAMTGKIISKIPTGAGSSTTPSGLAQINNFVDNASVNNTTLKVYGGDNLGNVWRFDVNDSILPTGFEAVRIGTATDASNNPQPITIRPELAELDGKPMVFVATGRLLGATDVGNLQSQSIYGIVDTGTGDPVYPNLRSVLKPLTMTQTGTIAGGDAKRTVACAGTTAQCGSTAGWVVDLPDSGERVNVDMKLVLGVLVIGSNVPQSSACSTGGYSWFNYLNFSSGTSVASSPGGVVSEYLDSSLIVGFVVRRLPNGQFKADIRMSDGKSLVKDVDPPTPPPKGKRISWREIAQ